MGSSLKLFSIRGIDVRLHITFPLILIWAAFQFGSRTGSLESALFGVIAIILLFILVTLHEFGHSFAAQYYGVSVKQIILSPLGGVAQLNQIPDKPVQEFIIAVAGPAVNVIIALLMGLMAFALDLNLSNPLLALSGLGGLTLSALFVYVFYSNIILALFNLIPAFPLDGGRIFRALLAMRIDYLRATTIAANVGKVVAILLGLYGLFNGGVFMMLIAIFIYTAGSQEAQMVMFRDSLRSLTVGEVYSPSAYRLNRESTVQQASNLMVYGHQRNFPVVEEGRLIGFLPYEDLRRAINTAAPHSWIAGLMRQDIEPISGEADLYEAEQRMGQEKIEALPVVNGSNYLGMITRQQIFNALRMLRGGPRPFAQGHSF